MPGSFPSGGDLQDDTSRATDARCEYSGHGAQEASGRLRGPRGASRQIDSRAIIWATLRKVLGPCAVRVRHHGRAVGADHAARGNQLPGTRR